MAKALLGVAAALLLCGAGARLEAQQVKREPIKQPPPGVSGAVTFKEYCAQCHGTSGRGDGPAAKALKVPPADLTQISKRHNGQFPSAAVRHTIAGDDFVSAHGTREMPIWGPVFRSVEDRDLTELRIANLVRYVEQLQER